MVYHKDKLPAGASTSESGNAAKLQDLQGICDLCGKEADTTCELTTAIACSYRNCDCVLYHQECVEKYLKFLGLERNRKIGFSCPRGQGKGTRYSDKCPGKVERSHPIINQKAEKRKKPGEVVVIPGPVRGLHQRQLPQPQQQQPLPTKPVKPTGSIQQTRKGLPAAQMTQKLLQQRQVMVPWNQPHLHRPPPPDEIQPPPKPELPVGLDPAANLTKAQKKNLRRAEKKKQNIEAMKEAIADMPANAAAMAGIQEDEWEDPAKFNLSEEERRNFQVYSPSSSVSGAPSMSSYAASSNAKLQPAPPPKGKDGLPLMPGTFVTNLDRYNQLLKEFGGLSSEDDDAYTDSSAANIAIEQRGVGDYTVESSGQEGNNTDVAGFYSQNGVEGVDPLFAYQDMGKTETSSGYEDYGGYETMDPEAYAVSAPLASSLFHAQHAEASPAAAAVCYAVPDNVAALQAVWQAVPAATCSAVAPVVGHSLLSAAQPAEVALQLSEPARSTPAQQDSDDETDISELLALLLGK